MENHYITIENRERITISRVKDVDAFDEETLWANLEEGSIEISGEKLNIEKLDLQDGTLIVTGRISAVVYTDRKTGEKGRFFRKIASRQER